MEKGSSGWLAASLVAALVSAPAACGSSPNCTEGWCEVGAPTAVDSFDGVWGSSNDDVWIVGEAGTILRWNGSAWSSVKSGTAASLLAVWGSGPGKAVWAAGHTEGAGKLVLCGPTECVAGKIGLVPKLNCVWGTGLDNVWAGGDEGTMIHFTGASFATVPTASPMSFHGIWGSGPSDVWAVGSAASADGGGGMIQHWDGTAWSVAASGGYLSLNGIWGSGPADVWAVGDDAYVLRWDGATWSPAPSANVTLRAVGGSGPTDVWAVGDSGTIWHHDAFSGFAVRTAKLSSFFLNSIWGSAPGDMWVVGSSGTGGTIFRHQP